MKLKHDIWKNKEGLTALIWAGDLGKKAQGDLKDDYQIVCSFYAESHYDAMTKYYAYMDWGIYETEFEGDRIPYTVSDFGSTR